MARPRPSFRPDIEGLRAIAVVLVVLNHLLAVPAGGFIGVDLFFVISGFVITSMLWRESSQRRFSFKAFYLRRVRRLLPSAVLVLLATNVAAQFFFFGPRVQQTRTDSGWALAFLANVHMARTDTDYFHANDAPSLLQHYWSLAVEEQFYFVWPLVLVILTLVARRRVGTALVLPTTIVLTAASFAYALRLVQDDPARAYFSAPARAWELGAGAILGLLVTWGLTVPRRLQRWFGRLGVLLLITAAALIDPTQPFPGVAALVPVGAGLSLILAGTGRATPGVTKVLSHPFARYIGRISYPVYLWHWPVIVISEEVWGRNALVWVAAPFVSVLLAVLTHHLVEDPLRGRVKPRQAYRDLVPMLRGNGFHRWVPLQNAAIGFFAYALVLTSIAVTSVPKVTAQFNPTIVDSAVASSPLPKDVSPEQAKLTAQIEASLRLTKWSDHLEPSLDELPTAAAPEWVNDSCLDTNTRNERRCRFGAANASHHAVILGDSFAISYLPGLRAALESKGWDFQVLTMHLCNNSSTVLQSGRPYSACDGHRKWAIERIQAMRPDLVVLSNQTNIDALAPQSIIGSPFETWRRGLTNTLRSIVPFARRVVVLAPPPAMGNFSKCRSRFSSPRACVTTVSHSWDLMSTAESLAATSTAARYVKTDTWFCSSGVCPGVANNIIMTIDGGHLTADYSRFLAPALQAALS